MVKDYLFKVKTIENTGELWKGSIIYVKREFKNLYEGVHASKSGSYHVTVPKDKCIKLDELE